MTYLEIEFKRPLAYVYAHFRKDTNELFYVGKGSGNRAYNFNSRSNYWKNIVKKSGGFTVNIIANCLTNDEAYNFEKIVIKALRAQHKSLSLCNLTDGGEGILNPSKETREKQRLAKLGKKLTEEHKQKIGIAGKGRKSSGWKWPKEALQRRIVSQTGLKRNEQACKNISEAKKAKKLKCSEETKRKISETKRMRRVAL